DPNARTNMVVMNVASSLSARFWGEMPFDPERFPPEMQALQGQIDSALAEDPPDLVRAQALGTELQTLMADEATWSDLRPFDPQSPQGQVLDRFARHFGEHGEPVSMAELNVVVHQEGSLPQPFPVYRFERED